MVIGSGDAGTCRRPVARSSPAAIRICARRDASTTFVVRTARRAQERGWANNAADLKLNVMAPALSLCIRGRMGRSSVPVPPMTNAPVRVTQFAGISISVMSSAFCFSISGTRRLSLVAYRARGPAAGDDSSVCRLLRFRRSTAR